MYQAHPMHWIIIVVINRFQLVTGYLMDTYFVFMEKFYFSEQSNYWPGLNKESNKETTETKKY